MCYNVLKCEMCGEWLDEFSDSNHVCRVVETKDPVVEAPLEIRASRKKMERS